MPGPKALMPITPDEAARPDLGPRLPNFVIKAFNTLIRSYLRNGRAVIPQNDVISQIIEQGAVEGKHIVREEIFEKSWLEIEAWYRTSGWRVIYDKASVGDTGGSSFIFEAKATAT